MRSCKKIIIINFICYFLPRKRASLHSKEVCFYYVRQRFHRTGYNCNRAIPGTDWPCISTGLLGMVLFETASRFELGLLSN